MTIFLKKMRNCLIFPEIRDFINAYKPFSCYFTCPFSDLLRLFERYEDYSHPFGSLQTILLSIMFIFCKDTVKI